MNRQARRRNLAALSLLVVLGACGSGGSEGQPARDPAELKQKAEWLQQFSRDEPAKAERFSAECQQEVGLSLSAEGAAKLLECVERKAGVTGAPAK